MSGWRPPPRWWSIIWRPKSPGCSAVGTALPPAARWYVRAHVGSGRAGALGGRISHRQARRLANSAFPRRFAAVVPARCCVRRRRANRPSPASAGCAGTAGTRAVRDRRRNELGFQLARTVEGSPQMGLKLDRLFRRSTAAAPSDRARRRRPVPRQSRRSGARSPRRPRAHDLYHAPTAGRAADQERARPPGGHDRVGVPRARFLRVRVAPFALDQYRRAAGREHF